MVKTPHKTDYPPLLEPGFHVKSLEQIKEITVLPFPDSIRRPLLFSNLELYCQILERFTIPFTLWIDGSFVTEKLEPEDIDIVVLFDKQAVIEGLDQSEQESLLVFSKTETAMARFNIHSFFVDSSDRDLKAYWRGLFSFLRDEITPKGLIALEIEL